jgi:hypothetical protein
MPEKRIDFRIGINLGDVVIGAALGRHIKGNRKFADSPLEGRVRSELVSGNTDL